MKPYKVIWIAALFSVFNFARADVYKCSSNGKTTYQAAPCQNAGNGQTPLNIKPPDPAKEVDARLRYEERQRFYLEDKLKRAQIDLERARANSYNAMAEASRTNAEARLMESESRLQQNQTHRSYYNRPRLADRPHISNRHPSSRGRYPSLYNR